MNILGLLSKLDLYPGSRDKSKILIILSGSFVYKIDITNKIGRNAHVVISELVKVKGKNKT